MLGRERRVVGAREHAPEARFDRHVEPDSRDARDARGTARRAARVLRELDPRPALRRVEVAAVDNDEAACRARERVRDDRLALGPGAQRVLAGDRHARAVARGRL